MCLSTVTLNELHSSRPQIDLLCLRAVRADMYLVGVEVGGEEMRVVNVDGTSFAAHSQLGAKVPFKGLAIECAVLRQESSYDEMVGQPARLSNQLEIPVSLPDNDLSRAHCGIVLGGETSALGRPR